ncbi:hypothetical protein DFH08DRAFT_32633 [Mycena albidolilacea]|uniref:F-box domain-containing protein n=1 Tax=Mycena albidolilacea TaxID=1033008 RepID=A0AAD7AVG6_9AGAR|nr:hypothetical protein DFH08DRAFT_32633 [Mycena albidolilacea]
MSDTAIRPQASVLTSSTARQQLLLDGMQTRLRELQPIIVHPTLTLPPEIISKIFLHCLPAKRESDVANPKEAPLLLTQVSRAWRDIAISTPELWSAFDVEIGWPEPNLLDMGETWLKRARERPLSVKLASCGLLSDIDHIDRFVTTLWGRSRGIRALDLRVSVEDFDVIDTPVSHDFGILQKLSFHLQQGLGGSAIDREPLALFRNAPVLSEVLISEVPPSLITLPWHQLTKFTGEIYTIAECLEALRLMPNLIHCTFAAFDSSPSSPTIPRSFSFSNAAVTQNDLKLFTHPTVQHLELFGATSDSALRANSACILAFLTLPALETLEIRGVEDYDKVVLDSFLSRSAPPLRKLSVRPDESQKAGTNLCLSHAFTTLPLTDLEVWYPESSPVQIAEMGTSIASRRYSGDCAKLLSVRVVSESRCTFSEADLLPFKQLKASGLDVHVGLEDESVV